MPNIHSLQFNIDDTLKCKTKVTLLLYNFEHEMSRSQVKVIIKNNVIKVCKMLSIKSVLDTMTKTNLTAKIHQSYFFIMKAKDK